MPAGLAQQWLQERTMRRGQSHRLVLSGVTRPLGPDTELLEAPPGAALTRQHGQAEALALPAGSWQERPVLCSLGERSKAGASSIPFPNWNLFPGGAGRARAALRRPRRKASSSKMT